MRSVVNPILTGLVLVLLTGLVAGAQSQAQTVYVNGCAAGPGNGSLSNPYNTLTRAVDLAPPGSTLVVQSGSYPERLTIEKKLTITASGGPVLIGQYYVGTQERRYAEIKKSNGSPLCPWLRGEPRRTATAGRVGRALWRTEPETLPTDN